MMREDNIRWIFLVKGKDWLSSGRLHL